MKSTDVFSCLPERLLPWYRVNRRDLPWRQDKDPYHIWVSEIMLQQTRVEAVKGYYGRFLHTLPTVQSLAEADDELLHKLWEGLGYYSRVRNMKKAAAVVAGEYGGVFPGEYALFTMHRAESEENHAQNLQRALEILCRQEIPVLYPVHPRMRPYLEGIKEKMDCRAIRFLPPVPYGVLLSLLLHARVCLTDSGTLQKESWLLETPCITLRPETEWPETLLHGWNTLCPAPFDTLPALFAGISRGEIPDRRAQRQPFLGEEAVAARIARVIQKAVTA